MKIGKLFLSFFFCFTLLQNNFAQNKKQENNKRTLTIDTMIEQLKVNPITNYYAAYWFSQLTFTEKREYSKKLGKIILDDNGNDSSEFIVAFGSYKSPYPWVFYIAKEKENIKLYGNNKLTYTYRNDKYVQNKWGAYWTGENYITKINNGSPIFILNSNNRDRWFDLWIPTSGWQYVGPELEKTSDTLNADRNLINQPSKR